MLWVYSANINMLILTVWGSTLVVRICRRQILSTKVYPRAVRVKALFVTAHTEGLMALGILVLNCTETMSVPSLFTDITSMLQIHFI